MMRKRFVSYSVAVGLALLLIVPAVALSQGQGGPGRRGLAAAGRQQGPMGRRGMAGANRQRGQMPGRGSAGSRGRQRGPGGLAGGFGAGMRDGRDAGLASRVLARAEQLGLSDEQRDRVQQLQRARREATIERRAATEVAALDLRELMRADSRDVDAIEAKLHELAERRISEQTSELRADAELRGILTVQQLEQLDAMAPPGRRGGRGGAAGARRGPMRGPGRDGDPGR